MVRPLPHYCARARRDFRRDGRQGQDREAERRREPEDGLEIRRDVDPDPDDLQGRRNGLAPGRRRAEAEAAAVDYGCRLIAPRTDDSESGRLFAGRLRFFPLSRLRGRAGGGVSQPARSKGWKARKTAAVSLVDRAPTRLAALGTLPRKREREEIARPGR